jgi:hypothetical protein
MSKTNVKKLKNGSLVVTVFIEEMDLSRVAEKEVSGEAEVEFVVKNFGTFSDFREDVSTYENIDISGLLVGGKREDFGSLDPEEVKKIENEILSIAQKAIYEYFEH